MNLVLSLSSVVFVDGQSARVRTGDVGTWRLCFVEEKAMTPPWRIGGATDTLSVEVRSRPEAEVAAGCAAPLFPTDVYGDGFDAFWAAPRRIDGTARLHGRLFCDLMYGGSPVTGRVSRIDLVTTTTRQRSDDPSRWDWESTRTRQLDAVPDRFDDGLVRGEERYPGVFASVRPDPWISEIGVLLHIALPA